MPREYGQIVRTLCDRHAIVVRRWRTAMSGCAWRVYNLDGRVENFIESPRPKTPISLAIFLHEVGHHAIGFNIYRRRCEEEFYAWQWAIDSMIDFGVPPDARVWRRYELSMRYAVVKAVRGGVKQLPEALAEFLPRAA